MVFEIWSCVGNVPKFYLIQVSNLQYGLCDTTSTVQFVVFCLHDACKVLLSLLSCKFLPVT